MSKNIKDANLTQKEQGMAVGVFNQHTDGIVATLDSYEYIVPEAMLMLIQKDLEADVFSEDGKAIAWGLQAKLWTLINTGE